MFNSQRTAFIISAITLVCGSPWMVVCAQSPVGVIEASVDANTRWTFRSMSPVVVNSSIVRLADVIAPIDPNQSGWQRLGQKAIGLVPVSGEPMTIRRDRLTKFILAAEATPRAIDWHGPTEINVIYRKPDPNRVVRQVQYQSEVSSSHNAIAGNRVSGQPAAESLSMVDAKRIVHWVELALERFYPEVAEGYEIEVPLDQTELAELRYLNGVTHMEAASAINDGSCRFTIVARSSDGPIEAEVEIKLTSHPKVVVPTRNLGRGKRIQASDLELQPFPENQIDPQSVADPQALIGKEVRTPLRTGRPIMYDDVGSPILVHRGDLIEVRVIGGGVTVTTNAKSLGDGAESDLIEIETLNPRKRLVARVAQTGTVEIITRAPMVR